MRTLVLVVGEVAVNNGLHFLVSPEQCRPAFDMEVLAQERGVEVRDDTVRLRVLDHGGAVLGFLELSTSQNRALAAGS